MLTLILTLSLTPATPAVQTTQIKPCVWPNVCRTAPAPVLTVSTGEVEACILPKKCGKVA